MEIINEVLKIATLAGDGIMKVYNSDFSSRLKQDKSPITDADEISNSIIIKELEKLAHFPIITEESPVDYSARKYWSEFWLIDPIDGTKDFIVKNGEFTINIALISDNKPVIGVVYIPATKTMYYAQKGHGAFKNGVKIYNSSTRTNLIAADSNFHSTKEMDEFFKNHNITDIRKYGSAIKMCKLAEGEIDVYPRLNGTWEWDTAAAHIIANEGGCKLVDVVTKEEIVYNRENMLNNHFISSRNDLNFV